MDVARIVYDKVTTGGIWDLRYMVWPLINTVYVSVVWDCSSEDYNLKTMFVSCIEDLGIPEGFDELIELADLLASLDAYSLDVSLDTP